MLIFKNDLPSQDIQGPDPDNVDIEEYGFDTLSPYHESGGQEEPEDKMEVPAIYDRDLKVMTIVNINENWDKEEKPTALDNTLLIRSSTAFSKLHLSEAMKMDMDSLISFTVFSEIDRNLVCTN